MSTQNEGELLFYVGSLGSGKTSFAFEEALEHLLRGGTVVTNIKAYPDKIAEWMLNEHGLVFEPDRLIYVQDGQDIWKEARVGTAGLPSMLIIDEAHVEHNARKWDKTSDAHILFNTMTRKLKVKLVYVTQDINNVDKQFRRMAQKIVYCRNLAHFKLFGFIRFPFNLFLRIPYVVGPGATPLKQSAEVTMRPLSWGMFDSHSLVGRAQEEFSVLQAAQTSPLKRVPKPKKPASTPYALAIAASVAVSFIL